MAFKGGRDGMYPCCTEIIIFTPTPTTSTGKVVQILLAEIRSGHEVVKVLLAGNDTARLGLAARRLAKER